MASYRGHLSLAAPLGAAYGCVALLRPEFDWSVIFLGAGLTTIGGLLPDLDSDSGVPVRELFSLAAAGTAGLVLICLRRTNLPLEQVLVWSSLAYFTVRYIVSQLFSYLTVHRGMFHSIPAMAIAGLITYHLYPSPDLMLRFYLSGGVMLGFLSHLLLDELCSVDFNGIRIRFNKFAGSALKFGSSSWVATLTAYSLMLLLGYLAFQEAPAWMRVPDQWHIPSWAEVNRMVVGR